MQVITIALEANEFKQYRKGGAALEITDSIYPVSINLYSQNGSQTNALENVLSGHFLKARFGAFDIKNGPTAQTVTILAMDAGEDGGSRRQPGNVSVMDVIGQGVQTVGAGSSAITALTASVIVAPAANTGGVMIRGLAVEVQSGVGGNSDSIIVAAPSTPVGTGGNMVTLGRLVDTASVRTFYNDWNLQKKIPAGWGIYHIAINSAVAAVANGCRISYEVL